MTTVALLLALLAAAPEGQALKLPRRIEGWTLAATPDRYTPATLFEYIDGGAEAFLQFDFEALTSATYVDAKRVELVADLYRHASATRAFGIYSQERRPGSRKMPGALEGVAAADHLAFVAGAYYVKLALPGGGDGTILPKLAEAIARALPGPREPPPVLDAFPDEGKQPRSEKLSARDFLGQAFLHDAAAVPYRIDGARFRLFVIEGKDEADVRRMIEAWQAVAKLPKTAVAPRGSLTIQDPLNGPVALQWRDRWLWGAVDEPSPRRPALLEALGRKLPQR